MYIIGLTGPSGAGKTTALRVLEQLGGQVYDCDAIYHEMLRSDPELLGRIEAAFPGSVVKGALDRKTLGAKLFADPAGLQRLTELTQPLVAKRVLEEIAKSESAASRGGDPSTGLEAGPPPLQAGEVSAAPTAENAPARHSERSEESVPPSPVPDSRFPIPFRFAVIDAIGLFESGLGEQCDLTAAVIADPELRVKRLTARDGVTEAYARARIAAQKSADWYAERAELTLENNDTEEAFAETCRDVFSKRLLAKPNNSKTCGRRRAVPAIKTKEANTMSEKTDELRKSLLRAPKNGYDRLPPEERAEMERYCRDYMKFMDAAKTEREAVRYTVEKAEEAGFVPLIPGMELKPGMKVYRNNRGKSAIFAVIGREHIDNGAQIVASHIDSPRMDIKPNPLYEDAGMAYLKTHYYGGIKKYQWTTIPLSIHGIVAKKDGSVITVRVGDEPNDPCFIVTDLLIHLSADQMKKTLAEGVTGEALNILIGSEPIADDEGADRVKLAVMQLLNEKYGIVEEDFLSAELTMVPASPAREIGFDRSLIGAYGHDDRVCAWASFEPLLDMETPEHTAVCVLADKEEIGSVGVSGMQSHFFETFMADVCECQQGQLRRCLERSFCLSCDVSNAFDPIYAETCDKRNNSQINYGIALCKYTGSRGKGGCSDASGEVMGRIRRLFDDNGVIWQTAELGKVDQGGGGTVAAYMANRNIDTLDAGVPVLSMHAPMEVVSKLDCYMTMKGMKAVYHD